MNVLSLFDGISVGQLALREIGIPIDKYYASEVERNAIAVTQNHFPETVQLGDVRNWKEWNIPWEDIDLLIGGSPCFRAGTLVLTRLGYKKIEEISTDDEVLTHMNRWRRVVSVGHTDNQNLWKIQTLGGFKCYCTKNHPFYVSRANGSDFTEPIFKNAEHIDTKDYLISHVSPGSEKIDYDYDNVIRVEKTERMVTVYNIEVEEDHTYVVEGKIVHNCQNLSLAGDKTGLAGVKSSLFYVYRDILNYLREQNPEIKFLLENVKCSKDNCAIISQEMGVEPVRLNSSLVSAQRRDRLYWTNINDSVIPTPDDRGLYLKDIVDHSYDGSYPLSLKHMEAFKRSYDNWSPNELTEKSKPILASYYKQPPHCPYIPDSKSESGYRRLSPKECERCQTLPDDYTNVMIGRKMISDTGRYRCIGNSWTKDMIVHILGYIKYNEKNLCKIHDNVDYADELGIMDSVEKIETKEAV